jgi:hypothetical protein
LFHSSKFQPRLTPVYNGIDGIQIDRAQDLRASITLNRVKVKELGSTESVCWKTGIPSNTVTLRQLEYGDMAIWQALANVAPGDNTVTAPDYKVSLMDISVFLTDDLDIFKGTLWYPKLRMSSFSLNIGDPDALIERNFNLVNEDEIIYQNNNKYVVYLEFTAATGAQQTFTIGAATYIAYPDVVQDPDNSGQHFLRVYRYRSSDSSNTAMVEDTDFTFNSGSGLVTILVNSVDSGDVFQFVYTASSYVSGVDPFESNITSLCAIKADECDIFLRTSTTVSKLQSISFEVNFDRLDIKEIGTTDVVAYGARDITTTVSLGSIVETWSIDEAMRNKIGASYGVLNVREYGDDMNIVVKVYEDNTKATFKMGYRLDNLSPTTIDDGDAIDDYQTRNITLEGDSCTITSVEGTLDA